MSTKPGQATPPPAQPRNDSERETGEAVDEVADKTEVDDRDLATARAARLVSARTKI